MDRFFGYGSLVNEFTHDYPELRTAKVGGWRRAWRRATGRPVAFLTVVRDPGCEIEGVTARVPDGDWTALDLREASYVRAAVGDGLAIYHLPPGSDAAPSRAHPVLLSYLDVVAEGYLDLFGAAGLDRFFETTDGWDSPMLDDRAHPRYRRHRKVAAAVRHEVDRRLAQRRAPVFRA